MSKKAEHDKKPSPWKVVKGVGFEMLQGKKNECQHSDRVQPEASCADVVSAAALATGSSTHAHHEQGAVDGKTKYTLLCSLLVRLGSQVSRDVFDGLIHPQDLCCALQREPVHSKLQSLRKEGILNQEQWSKLYPVKSSSVSSTGFDNSLLIVLLRTICNLSPPATGWDLLPHSSDTSCESYIVRLKYCVSAVSAHAEEAFVSDGEFGKYRKQIQKTLVGLGGAEYEDAIRKVEKEEMDPFDEGHFKELLKQWKDNDNIIKDKLNEWECKMKTSRDADLVQPEVSCADVVSAAAAAAAATGSSTHTLHEQDASSDVEMPSEALGRLRVKSSEDEKDSSFTHPDPSQKKAKEEEKEVKQHADVILKVVLKLACGGLWVAGTALILTKYRDDPERMIQLFQQIALPAGVVLKYLFEGSITCILQVIDLHGLQTLWQNFESGLLKKHLENALITEDLYKLAKGDEIIIEVFLEETITAHLSVTSGLMARGGSFIHPGPSQKKEEEEEEKEEVKQHAEKPKPNLERQKEDLQQLTRKVEEYWATYQAQLEETNLMEARLVEQLQEKEQEREEQIREKGDDKANLQRQLEVLQQQSKEKEQCLANYQAQLEERYLKETNLIKQLQEKELQRENAQRQLQNMEEQIREKEDDKTNLERQLEILRQQLRERNLRETSLIQQLQEKELQRETSQRQLQEMEEQIREKEDVKANSERQLREMAQSFEERIREEEEEKTNLETQLGMKNQELSELETSLSAAQQMIIELCRQESCDWVISRGEIQVLKDKCLGKGAWGSVNEATYCGCKVAVKQIHELILSAHNRRLFEREMDIASRCRHPCLLQFIGATNDEGSPLFVTELMEMSLRALLEQRQLTETEISVISLDVSRALNYLHHMKPSPIVHRDVSSANVLLWRQGEQWRGKVSDYGAARFVQQSMTVAPGAFIYSAPETFSSNQTSKVDVYSFGVLLCEMCIGEMPDPERREEQVLLVRNRFFRNLVRQCLQADPAVRPDMAQIIQELEQFDGTD